MRLMLFSKYVSTGTIDEKIYQRQLQKGELADAMQQGGNGKTGGKAKEGRFTQEELRQLFQLNGATACDTRDLLRSTPAGAQWQVLRPCTQRACRCVCDGAQSYYIADKLRCGPPSLISQYASKPAAPVHATSDQHTYTQVTSTAFSTTDSIRCAARMHARLWWTGPCAQRLALASSLSCRWPQACLSSRSRPHRE